MRAMPAVLIGGILCVAGITAAPAVGDVSGEEVAALRASECPAKYRAVHTGSYTRREQARALRWRFQVSRFRTRVRPPVQWGADPFKSRAYRAKLHNLSYFDPLFYVYRKSESKRRSRRALERARDIAVDFVTQNPVDGRGVDPKAWDNKVTGDRVGYLSYLTRSATCEGMLTPPEMRELLDAMRSHGGVLADPQRYRPSNHGLFTDLGLALLADYFPFFPESGAWDRLAQGRFKATLRRRLDPVEGVWLEHSAGYQFLALKVLNTFVKSTQATDPELSRYFELMRFAGAAFVMPDGRMPQFGDTELEPAPDFAQERARQNGLEAMLRYVGSGEASADGVLGQLPVFLQKLADDTQGLVTFPRSGYAFVKDYGTRSYLGVTAGFHNMSHKHADDLSFDLFERGHRIVSDTGMYNKDDNEFTDFGQSSQAHSTLTADGKSFKLRKRFEYGSGIEATGESSSGWYAILGTNPLVRRQGVDHERLFLYRPREALIVVDRVESSRPHTYDRYFQLGPDLDIRKQGAALALRAANFRGELYNTSTVGDPRRLTVRGDDDTLMGYAFPRFRRQVPRWTVDYRSRDPSGVHVTTIALNPDRPLRATVPAGGDGNTLDLTSGGKPVSRLTVTRLGGSLIVNESAAR